MRSFIATVALFAITNARFLADEDVAADESVTVTAEAAPWAADDACADYDTARNMQFVLNLNAGTINASQTSEGVAWTDSQIQNYTAKVLTFVDADKDTPLTAEQTTTAEELLSDNITWIDSNDADIVWDIGVAAWAATPPSVMTYNEACIEPVTETTEEVVVEEPAVDSWGLSNVHAAFAATDLMMITTPASAEVEAKAEVLEVAAVEEVKEDGVVTTAAVPAVLPEAAVDFQAAVAEVKVMHGTIEGKTGWKSIGGGDDAGIAYQWAWEFKQSDAFGTVGELDFIWAVNDESTVFEVQTFNGLGGFGTAAAIQGKLRVQYEWATSTASAVDPVQFSAWDAESFPEVDTWNSNFVMDWFKHEADAKFAQGALSTLPNDDYWYPDQNLSRFTTGWEAVQDTVVSKTVRIAMTKNSSGADNLTAGALSAGIKEGGAVMVFVGTKVNQSDLKFATKSGALAVNWYETPEEGTGEDGSGDGSGDVDNSGTGDKEAKTDGASTVTAFGAAVIAAISALAF